MIDIEIKKALKNEGEMKYKILNIGCDDATEGIFEFNKEQFEFLNNVFTELNKKF